MKHLLLVQSSQELQKYCNPGIFNLKIAESVILMKPKNIYHPECQCNKHATKCHFDPAVYEATGRVSGGICDDCQHNTVGHHCEECKPFYYHDALLDLTDVNACKRKLM